MFRDLLSGNPWWVLPAICVAVLVLLIVIIDVARVVRYIPNARVGVVEKLWSSSGSVRVGPARARRRGRLRARPAARRLPLLPAVPVPGPPLPDGLGDAGQDRLRVRARRPRPARRPDAGRQRARRRLPRRARLPRRRRPEGPAAQGAARRHARHQPGAVRRHDRGGDLLAAARRAGAGVLRQDARGARPAARLHAGGHPRRERQRRVRPARRRHRARRPGPAARRPARRRRRRSPQLVPGARGLPRRRAAGAAARSASWSRARTTSTACSRPSS